MFALVDANAFYCSAEQVFRPDWRGKPMVVLSNNDGCVVAANRLAKQAGVKSFVPYFQMRELCQQQGIIACSSNYELYADLSAKMMHIISQFAPEQHIYSIDESFLSFDRCQQPIADFYQHGQTIRRTVWKQCRLPVCVGFGQTLTLAKIANHAAKKLTGYQGVCVIENEQQRINLLAQIAVADVWGIGRRIAKQLALMGIKTALQLANMPAKLAQKTFSIEIARVVIELNGQRCKNWTENKVSQQQIFSTRSVGKRITRLDELQQALAKHANIAARKARAQQASCRVLLCFANSSPFDQTPVAKRAIHRFIQPSNNIIEITTQVSLLAKQLYQANVAYYKIGVGLLDLTCSRHQQGDLFYPQASNSRLMQIYDGINQRYGNDSLFIAAQGISPSWAMKRQLLTPAYTTNWQALPVIQCK